MEGIKKILLFVLVLLLTSITSFAQQIQVKGTIVDKLNGESIIGASVVEVLSVMERLQTLTAISHYPLLREAHYLSLI
jgi:hypothetical protein